MKVKKYAVCLTAGFMLLGSGLALTLNKQSEKIQAANAEAVQTYNADLRGGAVMTYGAATNDGWTWVSQPMMNQTSVGGGIYVRMRNYTGNDTPITIQICDGNGGCYAVGTADLHYYTYDNQGENEVEKTYLYTTNIVLSPFFDGIVYLPYANYTVDCWGVGRAMNSSTIWKIMYGLQPLYNSFAKYTIGDAFTADNLNFDSSELRTSQLFADHFVTENYSDGQIYTTQELFTDFDPSDKDLLGGEMIKTTTSDDYSGPTADICSNERGIYGYGFYMRVRNYTADIWATLQVMGCEGSVCLPKENKPFYYYNLDGTPHATLPIINGNAYNGFCIPGSFDGFVFVPLSSLYNSVAGTPDRYDWLWGIFITVDAKSFPDRVVVFGDVFCATTWNTNFGLRDTSATTHSTFAGLRNTNAYGKVCHYPGFTDDYATPWAEYFLAQTNPCDTAAAGAWADVKSEYQALSANDKEILVEAVYAGLTDGQKSTVEKAMERYDLAVARQSLENFISRPALAGANTGLKLMNNNNVAIIVVVSVMVAVLGVSFFFVFKLRAKKER